MMTVIFPALSASRTSIHVSSSMKTELSASSLPEEAARERDDGWVAN
jgi:hypothetical protein